MEIVFNNYSFKKNKKVVLNDINFRLNKNNIYAFIGDDNSGKDFLFINMKKSKKIKIINADISNIEKDNTLNLKKITFLKYGLKNIKSKKEEKIFQLLASLNISSKVLNTYLKDLNNHYLKIMRILVDILNNKNVIVLKEPFYKMNGEEEENFIRIIKTLKKEYNITFIILVRDMNIVYKFIDYYFVIDCGKIISKGKRDELCNSFLTNIDRPDIYKFIDIIRKNIDKDFRYFSDVSDLVKEIYRFVR